MSKKIKTFKEWVTKNQCDIEQRMNNIVGGVFSYNGNTIGSCVRIVASGAWSYQQANIDELKKENKKLKKCVEFYADDSINHHVYHTTMGTDLTLKAKKCIKELGELE